MGACGAVVRDHTGSFVGASMAKLVYVPDVESAEAAGLVEGLKLASSLGAHSLLIQMDNLVIVEALKSGGGQHMLAGTLLEECRIRFNDFAKVELEHCLRESNMVAHTIAQQGRVDPPAVWMDTPPGFISLALLDDVAVV